MNKKDATIIKILADIKATENPILSSEQEEILARALDPEKHFYYSVEKLFKKQDFNK